MYVIIAGGGRTGAHLGELLLAGGHEVCLIDDRPEVVEALRREVPAARVLLGDGADPKMLEEAEIARARVLAAVTGDDEDNLVVATLARFEFRVPRVIGRVNNPRNAWLYTAEMGVDVTLNQADLMARLIAEEMSLGDMMILVKLRRGEVSLVEERIEAGAPAAGKTVAELAIPPGCTLAAVIRAGEVLAPRGNLALLPQDEVVALARADQAGDLARLLRKP